MTRTLRPSGALITGVVAKICDDAVAQAARMQELGDICPPVFCVTERGYLMPELAPLTSAAEVPSVLLRIFESGKEDADPEAYLRYVRQRARVVQDHPYTKRIGGVLCELLEKLKMCPRTDADVHGDATLANFMTLGGKTVAIDLSTRVHHGSPAQDISKLLLSFYGELHNANCARTYEAVKNFERACAVHNRFGYNWELNADGADLSLYLCDELKWDYVANIARVLSREPNKLQLLERALKTADLL